MDQLGDTEKRRKWILLGFFFPLSFLGVWPHIFKSKKRKNGQLE